MVLRAGRVSAALSDWEVEELCDLYRVGWQSETLAGLYGVSYRTIERVLRAKGVELRRRVAVVDPFDDDPDWP